MARGILIAGTENLLFSALAQKAAQEAALKSVPYALAPVRDAVMPASLSRGGARDGAAARRGRPGLETREDGGRILDWAALTPLSARALVLAAENQLGVFDTALLVCAAPASFFPADPEAADISAVVDRYIKNYLFLARELRGYFRNRGGTLAFVCAEGGAFGSPLNKMITAAFPAFLGELFAHIPGEKCLGFSGPQALGSAEEADGFASFIFKTLNALDSEKQTAFRKWHKFGGAFSFLSLKKR